MDEESCGISGDAESALSFSSNGREELNNEEDCGNNSDFSGYTTEPEYENCSEERLEEDVDFDNFEKALSNDITFLLMRWMFIFRIKKNAVSALLKILQSFPCFSHLPKDYRKFSQTPRTAGTDPVGSGEYHHFRIQKSAMSFLESLPASVTEINLCVNVDGLPLFKSSLNQLWPILFSINEVAHQVFCAGCYHGEEKPDPVEDYMAAFVQELTNLIKNGITLSNGRHLGVKLFSFICDAPAKSFLLQCKGHSGYHSCTRCDQKGERVERRTIFRDVKGNPRTHESFIQKTDSKFHIGISPLEAIPGIDMIRSFALDYQHLVCLGVMRKMIWLWSLGKIPYRLSAANVMHISEKLYNFRRFKPRELCRMPRHLLLVLRWKATEFRQFLLYTGPVALKKALPAKKYENFLVLFVAMRILLSPKWRKNVYMVEYARKLLVNFVKTFELLYGSKWITHNFHYLTHLPDDLLKFGDLELVSAFRFENFMQTLKSLVCKPCDILSQIIKRVGEMTATGFSYGHKGNEPSSSSSAGAPQFSGALSKPPVIYDDSTAPHYTTFSLDQCSIIANEGDSCVWTKSGKIIIVKCFSYSPKRKSMVAIGHEFMRRSDYFQKPCLSSLIDYYKVDRMSPLKCWPVSQLEKKMVIIPDDKDFVVTPLLHTDK